eukprot:14002231-Alexandrium_andersonii.AAC.1
MLWSPRKVFPWLPWDSDPRKHELLEAFEACTARAQKQPQRSSTKLWMGAFCNVLRADAESVTNRAGERAGGASRG